MDFASVARISSIIRFYLRGDRVRPFDEEQQTFNRSPLDDETLLSGQFWGELRVFLAVAKTKSFNRAAELTNTSQPTVSRGKTPMLAAVLHQR